VSSYGVILLTMATNGLRCQLAGGRRKKPDNVAESRLSGGAGVSPLLGNEVYYSIPSPNF